MSEDKLQKERERIFQGAFYSPKTKELIDKSIKATLSSGNEHAFEVYYDDCSRELNHSRIVEGNATSVNIGLCKNDKSDGSRLILTAHTHPPYKPKGIENIISDMCGFDLSRKDFVYLLDCAQMNALDYHIRSCLKKESGDKCIDINPLGIRVASYPNHVSLLTLYQIAMPFNIEAMKKISSFSRFVRKDIMDWEKGDLCGDYDDKPRMDLVIRDFSRNGLSAFKLKDLGPYLRKDVSSYLR